MLHAFYRFAQSLEGYGMKCESITVDKESFCRIQASLETSLRLPQETPLPLNEIRYCGLTITYKDKE